MRLVLARLGVCGVLFLEGAIAFVGAFGRHAPPRGGGTDARLAAFGQVRVS